MHKYAEVDYLINLTSWLNLHFLIISEIKWNYYKFSTFLLYMKFYGLWIYKLEQNVLMAQPLNLLIWVWKLHKANISFYVVSQSMWLWAP